MTISRRRFLRTVGGSLACVALAATIPVQVLAKRSDEAFQSGSLEEAIKAKYGSLPIEDSSQIQIKAPEIAENGAFVPVTISTGIPGATSISIFAEANFSPLVASFDVLPRMHPDVSLRIRMAKTSDITVLVKAGDKLYRATREVKVTIGGCGG
ncbi:MULTISPECIES: thiosulfate oxidation carrier protein SoxY [Prosthecochloris]|uniref:Thiosulfate oxidation carrier protein SoxY n=1 Tax=Prosthecochloris marina TaxID=2017681 RepID=A0A317T8N6_9CHLB|nr:MULTISPECIES: thiosulfate oxidation carrier protein SoxY [Prosthecochloris]PWW83032.1 thiosulfate oxidation carrier protein SoxY [Prosthecochloris marina]UZJ38653.1 thiosulfate oxidation carrier protein SoxY [Prosthecochloris sp. SCSIO W1103]